MDQLTGLDAAFLYMETEQTPMHVAGLTLYDLTDEQRDDFHAIFRSFFETRTQTVPIFMKKLAKTVFDLDHPGWVDSGPLDFDYHIKSVTLPKPGTRKQLDAWVAREHAKPLDRSKPMWQFTLIDGLEGGQGALYSKVHHAAVDGGAGMAIAAAIYDMSEKPRTVKVPEPKPAARKPTVPERAVLGLHDLIATGMREQLKLLEAVPTVMGQALDQIGKIVEGGGAEIEKNIRNLASNALAPKTPFNATMGRGRTYSSSSLSLADAKAVSKATGAKMNDVVMAICGGALRAYLEERKALPKDPLVAFVPVSLRAAGDATSNNQVLSMNIPIGTHIADPLKRLERIVDDSGSRKEVVNAAKETAPNDYTLLGAPLMLPGLMKLFGRTKLADAGLQVVNLCISNTMGPPFPLYSNGAKVTHLYPVSIATHGVGLNITVQSYIDKLDFGITAGAKAVPEPERISELLAVSLAELHAAAVPPEPKEPAPEKPAAKATPAKAAPKKRAPAAKTAAKKASPNKKAAPKKAATTKAAAKKPASKKASAKTPTKKASAE
ncbi:MAG: wax ester/triacylglycerol synthase family O-acyltransferase [Pseudomonadota bacterium]